MKSNISKIIVCLSVVTCITGIGLFISKIDLMSTELALYYDGLGPQLTRFLSISFYISFSLLAVITCLLIGEEIYLRIKNRKRRADHPTNKDGE